jgi:serine/threonine-protein kinase
VDEIKQIGKFKVVGKLGQGSFGVVLKGYDPDIRREVAIKVCTVADVGLRKRFAREAQISGNLQHKNIVTVFAADTNEDGVPYLVQEFLDGEDVRELIRRREPVPSNEKIGYLLQVARGLAHAHAHGVIHRDVKPANIRLLSDGTVKIMDFGIAKLASAETQLTQKGVTMGTASYLPPEQVRGGDLDHRADIFSFGVLAYEVLTYERPFQGNTLSALVYQILYKVPPPMSAIWLECPDVLSDLVAKCLEKDPAERFASMEEIFPRLERIAEEIEAGKWPALCGVSTVQAFLSDVAEDTGVMSQTEISRTARAVETLTDGLAAAAPAPPAAGRAKAGTSPSAALALETAPTQILAVPAAPPPAAPAAAPRPGSGSDTASRTATAQLTQQDLAVRAQQIRKLIEEGKLDDAKERLEKTMTERLEASGPAPPPVAAAPVTVAVPLACVPDPRHRTPAPPPARPAPDERPPAAPSPESDTGTGSSYRTAIPSLSAGRLWVLAAVAVLLVAVAAWFLLGRRGETPAVEETDELPAPVDVPQTAPDAPAPPPQGWVTVSARPWARVIEITDAKGYLKEVPADPYTPLRLELPLGQYRFQLEYHPDGLAAAVSSCEVVVVEGESATCRAEFEVPAVTDYFKASGWWR